MIYQIGLNSSLTGYDSAIYSGYRPQHIRLEGLVNKWEMELNFESGTNESTDEHLLH